MRAMRRGTGGHVVVSLNIARSYSRAPQCGIKTPFKKGKRQRARAPQLKDSAFTIGRGHIVKGRR